MPTARGTGTTVLLLDGRPVTRPPARGMGHNGWRMSKNVAAGTAQPGQEPAGQATEQATEADLSKGKSHHGRSVSGEPRIRRDPRRRACATHR